MHSKEFSAKIYCFFLISIVFILFFVFVNAKCQCPIKKYIFFIFFLHYFLFHLNLWICNFNFVNRSDKTQFVLFQVNSCRCNCRMLHWKNIYIWFYVTPYKLKETKCFKCNTFLLYLLSFSLPLFLFFSLFLCRPLASFLPFHFTSKWNITKSTKIV